jgi:uncharacterized protein (DUF433 family)
LFYFSKQTISLIVGRTYPIESGKQFLKPLVQLEKQEGKTALLSFTNLIEAHVLSAMRRVHGIPLPRVRQALEYATKSLEVEHPLANKQFHTDGINLFVQELGALVNTSSKQTAIREVLDVHLQRVERNKEGIAERLFPFTRPEYKIDDLRDSPRIIVIDPRISFGRPTVVELGIPVETLVSRYRAGEPIQELADDYDCKVELVEEAIRCALQKAA